MRAFGASLLLGLAGAFVPWNNEWDVSTYTAAGASSGDSDDPTNSSLFLPSAVAVHIEEQQLYIADTGNHKVKKLDLTEGGNASTKMSTFVGSERGSRNGVGTHAQLREPSGLALDPTVSSRHPDGVLYVADTGNHAISAVDMRTGRSRTLAGSTGVSGFVDGRGLAASFWRPTGLALAVARRQFVGTGLKLIDVSMNPAL